MAIKAISSTSTQVVSEVILITISNKSLNVIITATMQFQLEHIGMEHPADYIKINGCEYYKTHSHMVEMLSKSVVGYDPKTASNDGFTVHNGMWGFVIGDLFFGIMPHKKYREMELELRNSMLDRY